jgi:hypothetical protein
VTVSGGFDRTSGSTQSTRASQAALQPVLRDQCIALAPHLRVTRRAALLGRASPGVSSASTDRPALVTGWSPTSVGSSPPSAGATPAAIASATERSVSLSQRTDTGDGAGAPRLIATTVVVIAHVAAVMPGRPEVDKHGDVPRLSPENLRREDRPE